MLGTWGELNLHTRCDIDTCVIYICRKALSPGSDRTRLKALPGPFLVFDTHGKASRDTEALLEEVFETECEKLTAIAVICSVARHFYHKNVGQWVREDGVEYLNHEQTQQKSWQSLLVNKLSKSELSILQVTVDKSEEMIHRYKCTKVVRDRDTELF